MIDHAAISALLVGLLSNSLAAQAAGGQAGAIEIRASEATLAKAWHAEAVHNWSRGWRRTACFDARQTS